MVFQFPEPPYIASAAVGGPAVIYLVTPLRNALTLATLDTTKSAFRLYGDVFSKGLMNGWAGGHYMAGAALPGFLILGPTFHWYKDLCGGSSAAAVALTAVSETAILYGSETKNAQVAFNLDAEKRGAPRIANLQSAYSPFGAGTGLHIARNYLAMSGLRVFSKPCQDAIEVAGLSMSSTSRAVLGDFIANCGVSALSAPLHQLYGFSVTQRSLPAIDGVAQKSFQEASVQFLKEQYLTPSGRISSVAGRDIFLRVAYNASIFTLFGAIERTFVAYWPKNLTW